VTYLRQAALALDKTHRASIVHRDLKPENLYLTENEEGRPRIKILDFGIAKLVAESSTQANATRSIGTPLYMSPEQFLARPITGAADIYSLGLLAYTFLMGVPYWAEEARAEGSAVAFGMIAVHGPRELASARAARQGMTLPPAFDAWFARATAVAPAQRFPSATSAVAALGEALGAAQPAPAVPAFETWEARAPQASSPALGLNEATLVLAPGMATASSGVTTLLASRPPASELPMGGTVATPTRSSRGRSVVMAFSAAVMVAGILGVGMYFSVHHEPPRDGASFVQSISSPKLPADPGAAPPVAAEPSPSMAASAPSASATAAEPLVAAAVPSATPTAAPSSARTPAPHIPAAGTKQQGALLDPWGTAKAAAPSIPTAGTKTGAKPKPGPG
jgi:hypothetical protein